MGGGGRALCRGPPRGQDRARGARTALPRARRPLKAPAPLPLCRSPAEEQLWQGAEDRIAPPLGRAGTLNIPRCLSTGDSVTFTGGRTCPSKMSWSASIGPRPATRGWSWRLIWRAPVGHISLVLTFCRKRTSRPSVRLVLGLLRLPG